MRIAVYVTFCFISWLVGSPRVYAQVAGAVTVVDSVSGQPLAFATIKYGNNTSGTIADLDGRFNTGQIPADVPWVEVSCLGYSVKRVALPVHTARIRLAPAANSLQEAVIRPPYDKIKRILNTVIANKDRNNPDKYDWYQCKVYYKMLADMVVPDSVLAKDTSKDVREIKDFMDNQHLIMSETYSRRTWKRPQQLQEVVLGSRFSGLNKSLFTGLVTDVLPFHAYADYFNLNGQDYHNPVSRGYGQYYKFDLVDELVQGADTVWVLAYKPRGQNANNLRGRVYINSDGFAISGFTGAVADTMLKRDIRIEQQYRKVAYNGTTRWFPVQLNYIIDWTQQSKKSSLLWHLKGNSVIDSVSFSEDPAYRFDKAHTVKLLPGADERNDSAWQQLRLQPLDKKEARTYAVMDSFGRVKHFDKAMQVMSHLPEGRIAVGKVDIDLKRVFSSNNYENIRAGMGLQTNERLLKWLSLGGWAGYGFRDKQWKYGAFAEIYADKTREFVFSAGYSDDISDPGRVRLHPDLDKSYLNTYLLRRVDHVRTWTAGVKKRFGYWSVDLTARQQDIHPMYHYAWLYNGGLYNSYMAQEASLAFRYAFAERTAPFFNSYYSLGSKYPVLYGKVTGGNISTNAGVSVPYVQAVAAVSWQKHINRWGNERMKLSAGKLWSNSPLPLSRLFAGPGFRYDADGLDVSIYTFGGMPTMYPYGYYTDQYINFIFRHDFDRRLFKLQVPHTSLSMAPYIGVQYNVLYGTLQHQEAQQYVSFSVPDNAYHEAGILVNSLLRVKYLNLYYLTLTGGYFYHFTPTPDLKNNGKLVMGLNVEF